MTAWWMVPLAYLIGSVQWGFLVVRVFRKVDVRDYGSGKTGVTNVLRTAGKAAALLALSGDVGKGVVAVGLSRLLASDEVLHAAVAGAVIVGHIWPAFVGLRGGRGIAVGVGASAVLSPVAAAVGILVFAVTVAVSRYVSLGSVLSVVAVVVTFGLLAVWDRAPLAYVVFALAAGALIVAMHRDNIIRLLRGTERRLGERAL